MRQVLTSVVSRPRQLVVVLLVLGLPFFLNCAPIRVNTETLAPAKSREMTGIRRLAVLDFSGHGGRELSRDVEAALVGIRVRGAPHFTMVDREALTAVLQEMGLAQSQIIEPKTAAQIGKLIGAEAMVLGTVQDARVEDSVYTETREACADKKCRRTYTRRVFCTRRDVHVAFTPKVVRVSSGQIIASEPLRQRRVRRACPGDRALESGATLINQARQHAIEDFAQLIAPHVIQDRLAVLSKDSTKPPSAVKAQLAAGVRWAKEGRLDRACPVWKETYTLYPHGYALPYNLGLCAEASGQLDEAWDWYEQADGKTQRPVREISQALERIQTRRAQQEELARQLPVKAASDPSTDRTITQAQKRLIERGYDPVHADGRLGPQTQRALKAFQSDHQLPLTGRLDAATKTALGLWEGRR